MSTAQASVIAVTPGAFPASATPITFTGVATGLEVNGLTVGGVLFSYSLGNGNVVIDGGPGVTNNVNPPDVVSTGNNTGILTLALPSLETMFGYGYASPRYRRGYKRDNNCSLQWRHERRHALL